MKPILFYISDYPIYSYTFFILLGFIFSTFGFIFASRKEGIKIQDGIYFSLLCFVLGLVLARGVSIIVHYNTFLESFSKYGFVSFFSKKGFSFHGALLGVLFAALYFSREIKISYLKLLDIIAPFGALCYSFGRLGCYFNGCCAGRINNVQLYDALLNFLLFLFLLKERKKFEGNIFLLFLIGNSIVRFFIEYLRWNVSSRVLFGFITDAQVVSIILIAASLIGIRLLRRGPKNEK